MGTLQAESGSNQELLDDSGIGQDESLTMKKQTSSDGYIGSTQLLDLSDDVLLYILKHCNPRDLKALGYTCPRLGSLILDRTLWERVDAREHNFGLKQIRWLLKHALTAATTELLVTGHAKGSEGCLGVMNCHRSYMEPQDLARRVHHPAQTENSGDTSQDGDTSNGPRVEIIDMNDPRAGSTVGWSEQGGAGEGEGEAGGEAAACPGPQYTFTSNVLKSLALQCPRLTTLALEYCNIDCRTRNITHFPRTLKKLSLRGSKCYNEPLDKCFLFKIQDFLTEVEELDMSECGWVEGAALLALSKLPALRTLRMRSCPKLTEFVAYASLATRYGFKTLKVIDLRGSPVGDSEVSSFGWVRSLEELYAAPARAPRARTHLHYRDDELPRAPPPERWELQEPEYFKSGTTENGADEESDQEQTGMFDNNRSPPKKRKWEDTVRVCSCKSEMHKKFMFPAGNNGTESDSSDNDAFHPKRTRQHDVNEGASTSRATDAPKEQQAKSTDAEDNPQPESGPANQPNLETYVRFRQNRDPVVINVRTDDPENPENPEQRNQEPLHKILYVNISRRLHTMYRLSMPVGIVGEPADLLMNLPSRRVDIRTSPFEPRFDPTTLVTDSTVHRFGRADGEHVNYINIGPNGIQNDSSGTRPDRTNLRVLSITGFRHITNRSLVHLATAAPHLRFVDFSGTRVTEQGVENFKSLRPDCEVIYGKEKSD